MCPLPPPCVSSCRGSLCAFHVCLSGAGSPRWLSELFLVLRFSCCRPPQGWRLPRGALPLGCAVSASRTCLWPRTAAGVCMELSARLPAQCPAHGTGTMLTKVRTPQRASFWLTSEREACGLPRPLLGRAGTSLVEGWGSLLHFPHV